MTTRATILCFFLFLVGCSCSGSGPTAGGATPYVRCAMREPPAVESTVGALHLRATDRVLTIEGATAPLRIAAFRGAALADEPIEPALDAIEGSGAVLAVCLGSLGDDEAHVEALLRALSTIAIPTLVVMGGRDHPADLEAALAALDADARARVIDASGFRSIVVGGVALVPIAGAPDGRYARDDEACGLGSADVDAIASDVGSPGAARIAIGWAAPHAIGIEGAEAGSALVADLTTRIGASSGVFAWPDASESASTFFAPPLAGPPVLRADGSRQEPGVVVLEASASGLTRR